jgi:hypothetical protein
MPRQKKRKRAQNERGIKTSMMPDMAGNKTHSTLH